MLKKFNIRFFKWSGAFFLTSIILLYIGCMSPISGSIRKQADRKLDFSALLAAPENYIGEMVLCGGKILKVVNQDNGTFIEILQQDLSMDDRPKENRLSKGRFFLFSSKFLDPSVYSVGREITAAGKVSGKREQLIGEYEYTYPVIEAIEIYLYPLQDKSISHYFYPEWRWYWLLN